jgi:hypothetical protein
MAFCCLEYIKQPEIERRADTFIFYRIRFLMRCNHVQCARDAAVEVKRAFLLGCFAGRKYSDSQHFWNSLGKFISEGYRHRRRGWPSFCLYREIPANPRDPRASETTIEAESPQQIIRAHELIEVLKAECDKLGLDGEATWLKIGGYSYEEIAATCGCTRDAAVQRVRRGIAKLAAALKRRGII